MAQSKKNLAADIITVDMAAVEKLVLEGSEIVATPEAEEALVNLLALQTKINTAVAEAKHRIEERALKLNKNFASVQGERIKVGYQFFGAQYAIDPTNIDKLPKDLYKQETKYSIVTPALKKYLKENEHLPLGVVERERSKSITIKAIEQFEDVE